MVSYKTRLRSPLKKFFDLSGFSTSICPNNKEASQSWFHRNFTGIYT